ncbi:probable pectate lyase [Serendipita indica DSM 11827]|uniref:Pectate lyase n=1 Tax=Serendipita indica (strain DSM 11827) TaxID=1109443 RepID=G4THC4_SERID|nr:probable pectate lyase [Serendipita indica DSM 11827]
MSRTLAALAILAPLLVKAAVPLYGQCGGSGYTGETTCVSGATCVYSNEWYSQCLASSSSVKATSSTKTSSSTKSTSTTKSSSTKTSSSSTKTSSTKSATAVVTPTAITSTLPASSGYVALPTASVISGSFDGGMKRFDRAGSSGACQGQSETGEADAVFILESGATISNVIIGADQAEGIHCRGPCKLVNIWWQDVCEDAATFKQTGSGDVSYIIGGGAFHAQDKIFQHNGAGTVSISNFYASDFGKLYRACGNCDKSYERHVIVNNAKLDSGSAGVGININFGDTAKISNVCTTGKPTLANICCKYQGTTPGNEPTKLSCGSDSTSCIYSNVGSC